LHLVHGRDSQPPSGAVELRLALVPHLRSAGQLAAALVPGFRIEGFGSAASLAELIYMRKRVKRGELGGVKFAFLEKKTRGEVVNLGFSLRMSHTPREQAVAQVEQIAHVLALETLLDRKPNQLSGGQQQRVALGRAMVMLKLPM